MRCISSVRCFLFIGGLLGLLTACSDTVDIAAESQAIEKLSSSWLENTRARNAQDIADHFAVDAMTLSPGRKPVKGKDAIQAGIESDWRANPDFTIDWQSVNVTVSESGDIAWERGRWEFDADGEGPASAASGEYVTLFRKVDGAWKIALDIGVPTGN